MGYRELADAVVLQAVSDYRKALRRGVFIDDGVKIDCASDCESFFQSEWFKMLTKLKGKHLMRKLKEEYEDEQRNKN